MTNVLQYWWIPVIIVYNIIYAWLSMKNSADTGNGWLLVNLAWGCLTLWSIVSKYTAKEDMVFNALLYDMVILIAFQVGMVMFGATAKFNIYNWTGMMIAIFGLFIFKMGDVR